MDRNEANRTGQNQAERWDTLVGLFMSAIDVDIQRMQAKLFASMVDTPYGTSFLAWSKENRLAFEGLMRSLSMVAYQSTKKSDALHESVLSLLSRLPADFHVAVLDAQPSHTDASESDHAPTMLKSNPSASSGRSVKRIGIYLGLGALFFLCIPLIQYGIKHVIAASYADEIGQVTGLNSYLVTALSAVIGLIVIVGFKNLLFNWKHPMRGTLILLGVTVGLNVWFYFATRDNYAGKCYARTPDGIVVMECRSDGVEPKYGYQLHPITPEIINELLALEQGCNVADPEKSPFFNALTGDPQLWYVSVGEGQFDFFDGPCYHPRYSEMTLPVTQDIYKQWQNQKRIKQQAIQQQQRREEAARQEAAERTARERRVAEENAAEARRRTAEAEA